MKDEAAGLLDALAGAENPFSSTFVRDIWESVYDTEALHREASERLTKAFKRVEATGRSQGALITGPPGVGKSHLLNRFRRIVRAGAEGLVFQVRPLPGTAIAWHAHFVRSAFTRLFLSSDAASEDAQMQFLRLIETLSPNLTAHVGETAVVNKHAVKKMQDEYSAAKPSILAGIPDPVAPDALRTIFLFLFYQWRLLGGSLPPSTRAMLRNRAERCLKWLCGSLLDQEDKKRTEPKFTRNLLGPNEIDESSTSYFAVLKVLGGMAKRGTPIALIIDQIETISDATAGSYATAVHQLIDEAPGFLVITCGVGERVADFVDRRVFGQAAFDRMAECAIPLQPPDKSLYVEMVGDRVRSLLTAQQRGLFGKKADQGAFFPFTKAIIQEMTTDRETVPTPREVMVMFRDLLEKCLETAASQGHAWVRAWPRVEPLLSGTTLDPKRSPEEILQYIRCEFHTLQHEVSQELARTKGAVEDQELAGRLEDILREVSKSRVRSDKESAGCASNAVQFVVDMPVSQGIESVGVVFDSRSDGSLFYNRLCRLKTHFDKVGNDPDLVWLVRDADAPFKDTWRKCWERREELEGAGRLRIVPLEEASLVCLAALGRLLQAVKARDLVLDQEALHSYFVTVEDFREFFYKEGLSDSDPLIRLFFPRSVVADADLTRFVRSFLENAKLMDKGLLRTEAAKEMKGRFSGPELEAAVDRAVAQLVDEGVLIEVDRIVKLRPKR